MKKQLLGACAACIFLISNLAAQAPDAAQAKMSAAIKEYFKLDRENIHVQLNKNVYLSNETIWFKGYVTEKKTGKPFAATTNVYLVLRDEKGNIISSHLNFAENSLFEGYIKLEQIMPSGRYYIQAYTNFMNNFDEDESAIYEIQVINVDTPEIVDYDQFNIATTSIAFFPESGVFLAGVNNTIAVEITDCNGNGVAVQNARVVDAAGAAVTTFTTNEHGYGKFDLISTKNEIYKVFFEIDTKQFEKELPQPVQTGVTFTVNNYAFANKAVIQIKTNPQTVKNFGSDPLTFAIQQNDVVSYASFSFADGRAEQVVSIPNDFISQGINTIHLIDKNLQKYGERIIYRPMDIAKLSSLTVHQKRADSISLRGVSPLGLASFSISVLPSETQIAPAKNMYSALLFDNQMTKGVRNADYYLNDFSRKKHFELDVLLMTRKSKYRLESMMGNPPTKKFDFDSGLTVKGTVNGVLADRSNHNVKMSSPLYGINELAPINEKNEFLFENVMAIDSTMFHFSLLDKKQQLKDMKIYTQLLNSNRKFLKAFPAVNQTCTVLPSTVTELKMPVIRDAISLDEITVQGKDKKKELDADRLSRYNNHIARGFKLNDRDVSMFRDVLGFIQAHGYNVSQTGGSVVVTRRYSTSFSGSNSPLIMMDDAPIVDNIMLLNLDLATVDEIYINARGYGEGPNGSNGVIRIYTKRGITGKGGIKVKSESLLVKNGFQSYRTFKMPDYDNVRDPGFKAFGTIGWIPNVGSDQSGNFTFSIPNLSQKSVKVIIEGITGDGELYSETRTIPVE